METILIENFAGIKSMTFEFKSINVLIGPQGSGKSVSVKLLYFFKRFFEDIVKSIASEESKKEFDNKQKEKFIKLFPKESWSAGISTIIYIIDNTEISIIKSENNTLKFDYSDNLKNAINKGKKLFTIEKKEINNFTQRGIIIRKVKDCISNEISPISSFGQLFIPAGRSFFANIQKNIFSLLSDNVSLDPFLIEFGSFYEFTKQYILDDIDSADKEFDKLVSKILNSRYLREKDKDFLVHSDNRKVNLSNASSGQQEILPLLLMLKSVVFLISGSKGATIYIEEPEAHLFPIAQKRIVELLARTFNNEKFNFQIIVTTHSPYILSSFNNLIQAGRLAELKPESQEDINKVIPIEEQINPDVFTAYSLENGYKTSLIDEETGLIHQTILDSVSNEISVEFGDLLDIEF